MKKVRNKYDILFLLSFAVSLKRKYICMKKISGRTKAVLSLTKIRGTALTVLGLT